MESLGVDGRHWETLGDTNSGCWEGLELSGVTGRHQESLGVVEVVVVHSPTNHLVVRPEFGELFRALLRAHL